jgi:hypothetical protein
MADDDALPDLPDDAPNWARDLRDRAEKALKTARDLKGTQSEETRNALTKLALYESGLNDLDEFRRGAVLKVHEGDLTGEALRDTAVKLGYAEPLAPPPPTAAEQSAAAQQQIAQATAGADAGASGVINPETVAEWGMERRIRFMKDHPNEWEALKRGEQVTGIPV